MSNFSTTTIGSLAKEGVLEFGDGYRTKRPELGTPGIPILRVAEVLDGKISPSFADYVHESHTQKMGRKVSQPQDIILTTKGTVGRTAIIPENSPLFVYSPQVCYFRTSKSNTLDRKYLYYWFKSDQFWGQASSLMNQTDMAAYLNLADIRSLRIALPDLDIQEKISETLGALDDKIAANERIADTSRQLGMALHKEATASESRSTTVEELSSYLDRGQAPKYTEDEDSTTVLNQRCVRAGRVQLDPARRTLATRIREARKLKSGDVLVNSTGVGTLGRVSIWSHDIEATVDSHVTIVRINPEATPTIVGGFAMLAAQRRIEALGEGSTGQTELSKAKLGKLEIEIPSSETDKLADQLTSLERKADAALAESHTLAELRDTLLPQLMSGKLRVKDAEKIVEDNV